MNISLCILVSWKKYRFNPFCSDTYPNLSLMDFLLTLVPDIFVSLLTCLFYCKGTFCKSISCMIELNRTKLYEIANQASCFAKVSFERDESLKVKKSTGNEWWFIVNTDYRDLIMSRLKAEAECHLAFKSSSKSHRSLDLQHPGHWFVTQSITMSSRISPSKKRGTLKNFSSDHNGISSGWVCHGNRKIKILFIFVYHLWLDAC